jgi:cytochrome c-type biogenesis protein CcmH
VRERLVAGDTDQQATQFIVDRYGEYVLLAPVVAPHTLLLWISAPVILLGGVVAVGLGVWRARRRMRSTPADTALSPAEAAALAELESSRDK